MRVRSTDLLANADACVKALYFLGGASIYIENYGRLCFCPAKGYPENKKLQTVWRVASGPDGMHATSCDDAWNAFLEAAGQWIS